MRIYYSRKGLTRLETILIAVILCIGLVGATYYVNTQLSASNPDPTPTPTPTPISHKETLKVTADTFVSSDEADSNYGGQSHLEIENYDLSIGQTYNYQKITWLKFDLSSIPKEAEIENATLQLRTSMVSETCTIDACYCSDDTWTELGITWANMPTIGFISVDSVLVSSDYQWYSWNVIEAINFAKNNNDLTVVTIALVDWIPSTSSYIAWFYSKEASVIFTDYSPKLTISWNG